LTLLHVAAESYLGQPYPGPGSFCAWAYLCSVCWDWGMRIH
jgi:hypothetical protein